MKTALEIVTKILGINYSAILNLAFKKLFLPLLLIFYDKTMTVLHNYVILLNLKYI